MPPAASERKNRPKHMGPYQKVTERTAAAATARANATTRCLGCMCEVAKLVVKAEVVAAVLLVLATLPLPVMKVLHLVMV